MGTYFNGINAVSEWPRTGNKSGTLCVNGYSSSRTRVVVSALLIVSFFIGFSFVLFFEFDCGRQDHITQCPMKPQLFLLIHNYA